MTLHSQDLPFGGTKASGYGRFGAYIFSELLELTSHLFVCIAGGPEGLRSLTNPKAIIVDRLPWLIQTSIPKVLDYPVRSLVTSWYVSTDVIAIILANPLVDRDFVSGLVSFAYADGWRASIRGLILLVKAARK
jgi:hypothetical protein